MAGVNLPPEHKSIARRALLMLTLWLGFWLLALGLTGLLLWIPFAQSYYRSSIEFSGAIAACAAITLAYALRPRIARDDDQASGPPALEREQAPELFTFVERIGRDLGIVAPVEIHLVAGATAYISAKRSWYGRVKALRVGVGLPLFAWLSEREFGAVIAHEFGHFIGGDLSLGPWVYRTRVSIGATIHSLDESMFFLDAPFRTYGHWFMRLSGAVSRAQEYSADALSAQHFGAEAACAALEKIHRLDPLWTAYLAHDFGPAVDKGARVPILEGFRRFCELPVKRHAAQETIASVENRTPSPYDTHPSLKERLFALAPKAKPQPYALDQCLHLLGGEPAAESAWYRRFDADQLTETNWEEFGEKVLRPQLEKRFTDTLMAPERMALTELVTMARELDAWWGKLRPDSVSFLSTEAKRRYVLQIFEDWIIVGLCHHGFTPQVRPGESLVLVRDQVSVQPDVLLKDACENRVSVQDIEKMISVVRMV